MSLTRPVTRSAVTSQNQSALIGLMKNLCGIAAGGKWLPLLTGTPLSCSADQQFWLLGHSEPAGHNPERDRSYNTLRS